MPTVLDASALIALLRRERGEDIVAELLKQRPPSCLAHAINLCEVFYDFLRSDGEDVAVAAIDDLRTIGLGAREDMDEAFWRQAGKFKVHFRIPLADAIVVTLAERYGAEIVTADRGDFEQVARAGICRVRFIR